MTSAISTAIMNKAPMANTSGLSLGGGNTGALAGLLGNLKGQNWNNIIGNSGSILGNLGSVASSAKDDKITAEAYKAYQAYLDNVASQMQQALEQRADKYDTKLQNQFNEAEPQYQQEANTQLAELGQLVQDISDESAEAQRQNQRQINASLAQQGVRGGQAAILANRATGELNRDLQRDINKTVYDEALNRQNSRLNYYGQKALTPWQTMASSYGNSMVGANNALSGAQGSTYANAYNRAMDNYINTQNQQKKKKGFNFGGALSGAASGASMGSAAGPWGALAGGVVGGVMGGLKK